MFSSRELEEKVKTARRAVLDHLGQLCQEKKSRVLKSPNGAGTCSHNANGNCVCGVEKPD